MGEHITWDEEGREHLRTRSERCPEAVNIEPGWTQEVFEDPVRTILIQIHILAAAPSG